MKSRTAKSAIAVLVFAVLAIAVYFAVNAYAVPLSSENEKLGNYTGPITGVAQDDNVKASLDLAHTDLDTIITDTGTTLDQLIKDMFGVLGSSANVFFVDSGTDGTAGTSWSTAVGTLDEAINLCTADAGDIILIAPGHNEAVGASARQVDIDVNGVTIIGLGRGSLMPTFDYDGYVTGTFMIDEENVTIKNLRFRASVTDVNEAIDVNSPGDYFSIIDCEFICEAPGTDEFKTGCIRLLDTANDGLIKGCTMRMGAGAAISAIYIDADVVGLTIEDNKIWGDYSTAVIFGDEASDDIIIQRNILFNGTMGGDGELNSEPAIEVADSTAGFVLDNRIVSDVATGLLMRVADDMVFMNNYISDTDGDEFSGTTEDTSATVAAHADG